MLKRSFDVVVSLIALAASSPVWVVVAVLIKLDSRGPVFYRGVRVGKDGHRFQIYKFRTMAADSSGPGITRLGDTRVTRVGRVLRRLKIDELPQLLNLVRGEMSLVGPRPEDPRYVAHYTPEQRRVLSVRPGITSPATISYRHEEAILAEARGDLDDVYRTRVLPNKLTLDLDYVDAASFWLDLRILARTLLGLLKRSSADHS